MLEIADRLATSTSAFVPAGDGQRVQALRRAVVRVAREPFLHFLLVGALILLLTHYLARRSQSPHITVTQYQVQALADNYRLQYGAAPSDQQIAALVNNFIKDEIFYRQALRLGLDKDDEIIRQRLVQKYEFLQQDLSAPSEPGETQLRKFYKKRLDQYRAPEQVTFTQVYFSPEQRGEEGARTAAEELASHLNLQGLTRAADQGDRFPGAYDFTAVSRDELARVFGQDGLSEAVFGVELHRWSAPLRSGFGWHTVYVDALKPDRQASFEEVRKDVRRDYLEAERNQRNADALAKLREHFVIDRE